MKLWLVVLFLFSFPVLAAIESRKFDQPGMEDRYNELIKELRCLVCQNQNLADSNADLARDLRDITFTMLMDGKTNREITDFMVARYGEFVLYKPPFNIHTLLLWFAPVLLALIGCFVFMRMVRQRSDSQPQIDSEHLESARHLLDDEKPQS